MLSALVNKKCKGDFHYNVHSCLTVFCYPLSTFIANQYLISSSFSREGHVSVNPFTSLQVRHYPPPFTYPTPGLPAQTFTTTPSPMPRFLAHTTKVQVPVTREHIPPYSTFINHTNSILASCSSHPSINTTGLISTYQSRASYKALALNDDPSSLRPCTLDHHSLRRHRRYHQRSSPWRGNMLLLQPAEAEDLAGKAYSRGCEGG